MAWIATNIAGYLNGLKRLLIGFALIPPCYAQIYWPAVSQWDAVAAKHDARQMHDTVYLARAQALAEQSFKNPDLKDRLSKYKTVAWSNRAYQQYRVKYYAFLANHAALLHQEGYAIYYLQKMEEELKKIKPYTNSLNQPRYLLSIYSERGNFNFDKRIEIIDSLGPFLKALPVALAKGPVNINTCINAFTVLKQASNLYLSNGDTTKILEVRANARALLRQLKRKRDVDKGKLAQCTLSLLLIESDAAKALHNSREEVWYLNAAHRTILSNDSTITPLFRQRFAGTILGRLIDFHIQARQIDSAAYFLGLFRASVKGTKQNKNLDGDKVLRYTARLEAAKGNFKPAYENVLKAYAIIDSVASIKTIDLQNNMYAHLVAEQRREALLIEREKIARRNMFILGITTILIMTVALSVWMLRINQQKARRRIEKLNESTQIQIAELATQANDIQKRFGMDLHDDIAGQLVSLVNQIESQVISENDDQMREKLLKISQMARDAYASTRSKSHEWYLRGAEGDKKLFSDRVRQIVGSALADGSYEKQIEIDDECVETMSAGTRIQLLRIIQEAVANILKHARAQRVKLFIYEDEGAVVLQVADNGRGFSKGSSRNSLGLTSLKNRVTAINGSMEILSSEKGTEVLIHIPTA